MTLLQAIHQLNLMNYKRTVLLIDKTPYRIVYTSSDGQSSFSTANENELIEYARICKIRAFI